MKITPVYDNTCRRFIVSHRGRTYNVTIWLTESGRFIDWDVLNGKGNQASFEISEEIINKIEEKWDSL